MNTTLGDLLKPEVIRNLPRLDLKARGIALGFLSGLHRSPCHGFSVEFSEHRRYAVGDPASAIDWRVYARTDRYFVRRYEAETSVPTVLLLDRSASMDYASPRAGDTKFQYGRALAAALAFLMLRQKDPVGIAVFGERIDDYVPPRSRAGQLGAILARLERARPGGRADAGAILRAAARLIGRAGLTVVISDLLCDVESLRRGLSALRFRRQEVVLFHVQDPAERTFPFRRRAAFEDRETGERVEVDPEISRGLYLSRLAAWTADIQAAARAVNADCAAVDTSVPYDRALRAYLLRRQARG